ncbi:MAG: hypothetical protein HRK26_00875 [Rickettsiaceae bacterium H1]|nr:hypothetical protein [Rickettsiaceae bacterium H1]
MTKNLNIAQVYGLLSIVGINPIINFVPFLLFSKKKISTENTVLSTGISSFLTWSGIVFGISYAASKDLKLSGIIAGSLAAAVLLFQVSDFSIRRIKEKSTKDAIIKSVCDTGIVYGLTTGVIVTPVLEGVPTLLPLYVKRSGSKVCAIPV